MGLKGLWHLSVHMVLRDEWELNISETETRGRLEVCPTPKNQRTKRLTALEWPHAYNKGKHETDLNGLRCVGIKKSRQIPSTSAAQKYNQTPMAFMPSSWYTSLMTQLLIVGLSRFYFPLGIVAKTGLYKSEILILRYLFHVGMHKIYELQSE